MAPLYEYKCQRCGHRTEVLIRTKADELEDIRCHRTECQSRDMARTLTAHAGYSIKGDNSASTKPRSRR